MFEKLFNTQPDVLGDLAQQRGRDVAPLMKRYRRASPGLITELFVRSTLANFHKAQSLQNGYNLRRLENRNVSHG